jgi:ElaB/YqjD/DUF883 family membrane-anchored ribosome-binding protein
MSRSSERTDPTLGTQDLEVHDDPREEGLTTADLLDGSGTDEPDDQSDEVRLLEESDTEAFQRRWNEVQAQFVDDPRDAVRAADTLVAEVVQSLVTGFAQHKSALEAQWSRDEEPDTEQLRQALRRYRFFFSRLLAT